MTKSSVRAQLSSTFDLAGVIEERLNFSRGM